ncbi:MAG: hypothetical protein ACU83N_03555 [Gammaproteobacteria bacterium]
MKIIEGLTGITLMALLSGCTLPFVGGYGENDLTKEEFVSYAESVFKFQNQMTSQVMMLLETEEDLNDIDEILQAEQQMHRICEPLNEYAVRERDDLSVSLFLRRRVEKSVAACDKAARRVELYLKALRRQI